MTGQSGLSAAQVEQLLKPVNPSRVAQDGRGHAHLPSWDVLAHLSRVFGFAGFDTAVTSVDHVYEQQRTNQDGSPANRWDVLYRATVRLTVKSSDGTVVATYEDAATGEAQNQARGDAHDLALKSAVSTALKRAARCLGDQFGLGLYRDGRTDAVVLDVLVRPETVE